MQFIIKKTPNMDKYIKGLEEMGSPANMEVTGQIAAFYIKTKIPTRDGELRAAYTVFPTNNAFVLDWDNENALPYSKYQFYGRTYEVNKATFDEAGNHIGWFSPIKPKRPASDGRMMGTPAEIHISGGRVIYIEGYHTAGTGPFWTEQPNKDTEVSQPIQYNVGRYLYEEYCERFNLKPVGGYQVLAWARGLTNDS